jgi:hypothetical protein
MGKGVSDPDIVAIKRQAEEGMVTYLRVKLAESDNATVVKGEGKDMLTRRHLCIRNYYHEVRRQLSGRGLHVRSNQTTRDRRNDNAKQKVECERHTT